MLKILREMAYDLRKIEETVYSKTSMINMHLLMIYCYPDSTAINHWKSEIWNFLNDVAKIKGKNKYPTQKQLLSFSWDIFEDCILEQFDVRIKNIESKESKKITLRNPNSKIYYNFVKEYYYWLTKELSLKGIVSKDDIDNKIDELRKKLY